MYIDTSFERCEVCRSYVLLDQTQAQCAREHECTVGECPLKRYFTGEDPDTPSVDRIAGKGREAQ